MFNAFFPFECASFNNLYMARNRGTEMIAENAKLRPVRANAVVVVIMSLFWGDRKLRRFSAQAWYNWSLTKKQQSIFHVQDLHNRDIEYRDFLLTK